MYASEVTEASKSALLELGLVLKRYREDMVLAGGWAPYFITKGFFQHCGSIDVDLVLKTRIMQKYDTIRKSIEKLGYSAENPFRFSRIVKSPVDGRDYAIHLDFLCEKEECAKYFHLNRIQEDLHAFVFDGLDLAFEFSFEQEIETVLPGNGEAKTRLKVADLVASLTLKGHALDGRLNQKDAYDVFALTHYNGGPKKAAEYFNKRAAEKRLSPQNQKLLKHALAIIREKFRNQDQAGPFQVESFSEDHYKRSVVAGQVNQFLDAIEAG
ncbi:hypothetical protein HY992_00400 [Candidatus Micrarchaeota archaeon]|nr:hypothetical protein [Candidatus Micrarchaeota archaeon]